MKGGRQELRESLPADGEPAINAVGKGRDIGQDVGSGLDDDHGITDCGRRRARRTGERATTAGPAAGKKGLAAVPKFHMAFASSSTVDTRTVFATPSSGRRTGAWLGKSARVPGAQRASQHMTVVMRGDSTEDEPMVKGPRGGVRLDAGGSGVGCPSHVFS